MFGHKWHNASLFGVGTNREGKKVDYQFNDGDQKWRDLHMVYGGGLDHKKYAIDGDPLEREDRLRTMQGWTNQLRQHKIDEKFNVAKAKLLGLDPAKVDTKHLVASTLKPAQLQYWGKKEAKLTRKSIKQKLDEDFLRGFTEWLRGAGTKEEYEAAQMPGYENKHPNRPLSDHPTVLRYLEQHEERKARYYQKLSKMLLNQGRMGEKGSDMTIDDAWKYYKYVVKNIPMDEGEILDDDGDDADKPSNWAEAIMDEMDKPAPRKHTQRSQKPLDDEPPQQLQHHQPQTLPPPGPAPQPVPPVAAVPQVAATAPEKEVKPGKKNKHEDEEQQQDSSSKKGPPPPPPGGEAVKSMTRAIKGLNKTVERLLPAFQFTAPQQHVAQPPPPQYYNPQPPPPPPGPPPPPSGGAVAIPVPAQQQYIAPEEAPEPMQVHLADTRAAAQKHHEEAELQPEAKRKPPPPAAVVVAPQQQPPPPPPPGAAVVGPSPQKHKTKTAPKSLASTFSFATAPPTQPPPPPPPGGAAAVVAPPRPASPTAPAGRVDYAAPVLPPPQPARAAIELPEHIPAPPPKQAPPLAIRTQHEEAEANDAGLQQASDAEIDSLFKMHLLAGTGWNRAGLPYPAMSAEDKRQLVRDAERNQREGDMSEMEYAVKWTNDYIKRKGLKKWNSDTPEFNSGLGRYEEGKKYSGPATPVEREEKPAAPVQTMQQKADAKRAEQEARVKAKSAETKRVLEEMRMAREAKEAAKRGASTAKAKAQVEAITKATREELLQKPEILVNVPEVVAQKVEAVGRPTAATADFKRHLGEYHANMNKLARQLAEHDIAKANAEAKLKAAKIRLEKKADQLAQQEVERESAERAKKAKKKSRRNYERRQAAIAYIKSLAKTKSMTHGYVAPAKRAPKRVPPVGGGGVPHRRKMRGTDVAV